MENEDAKTMLNSAAHAARRWMRVNPNPMTATDQSIIYTLMAHREKEAGANKVDHLRRHLFAQRDGNYS